MVLLQLLFENKALSQYFINGLIAFIGRSLDFLSTRYVTKELKLETNKLAQKIGWKGMLIIQIPLIFLGALDFYFAFFIFIWSLFLCANNIEGSWYVKNVGEEEYQNELEEGAKNTSIAKIILGEISYLLSFTCSGILILIFIFILHDLIAVFFIALALIFQGILATLRSVSYLIDLRKTKESEESQERDINK
jgi:VIT1/CCC1 family predicted Fe2+/Mn2+ transporter